MIHDELVDRETECRHCNGIIIVSEAVYYSQSILFCTAIALLLRLLTWSLTWSDHGKPLSLDVS